MNHAQHRTGPRHERVGLACNHANGVAAVESAADISPIFHFMHAPTMHCLQVKKTFEAEQLPYIALVGNKSQCTKHTSHIIYEAGKDCLQESW